MANKYKYFRCNGNTCEPILILEDSAAIRSSSNLGNDSTKIISKYDKYNTVVAKVILQTFDKEFNHNGRIYDKPSYEIALKNLQNLIEKNRLLGELDHPVEHINNPLRLFSVLYKDASHVFKRVWIEDDKVMGVIKTLPTKRGRELKDLLLDEDVNVGFSLRADADEIPISGGVLAKVKKIITWDAVVTPSHERTKVVSMKPLFESIIYNFEEYKRLNKSIIKESELDIEYLDKRIKEVYYENIKKYFKYNI